MATEQGIVIKTEDTTAWVKTTQSSACKSCSSRSSCTAGSGNQMEVEAINDANAREGDRIVLEMKTGSLLKATFLLYLFPILCLIIGALIGQQLALRLNADGSVFAILVGSLFLCAAFFFIKIKGNQLALKKDYRPKIIRVLPHP